MLYSYLFLLTNKFKTLIIYATKEVKEMNDVLVRIILTLNGRTIKSSKEMNFESNQYKKVKQLISNAKCSVKYVNDFIDKNGINYKIENMHLCGNCDNMFKCSKVCSSKKKNLDDYPFILDGIEIITYDLNKNKLFNEALLKYKNEDVLFEDLDEKTKNILRNNGKKIELFNVFSCVNFLDDKILYKDREEQIKKIELAEKNLINYQKRYEKI